MSAPGQWEIVHEPDQRLAEYEILIDLLAADLDDAAEALTLIRVGRDPGPLGPLLARIEATLAKAGVGP